MSSKFLTVLIIEILFCYAKVYAQETLVNDKSDVIWLEAEDVINTNIKPGATVFIQRQETVSNGVYLRLMDPVDYYSTKTSLYYAEYNFNIRNHGKYAL